MYETETWTILKADKKNLKLLKHDTGKKLWKFLGRIKSKENYIREWTNERRCGEQSEEGRKNGSDI